MSRADRLDGLAHDPPVAAGMRWPPRGTVDAMHARIVLGHGASGTAAGMRPWVDGLRDLGLDARAIDLPRGRAERAVPVFLAAISGDAGVVPGGHSFGGRVASLAVARAFELGDRGAAGLVLLSYPLHPPGRPDRWADRTAHWPALTLPVLLLSGESDPFARLPLLREAVARLPDARLVTYPRVGHGLLPVLADALPEIDAFIRSLDVRR